MLIEKIARLILDTAEPVQALLGFGREIARYKHNQPHVYSGFMKNASALLGRDFLIDCFVKSANKKDVMLVQAIEKKAWDQKITRDEIANYIEQGGLLDILEKNAFAVTKKVNSQLKPQLRKQAGIGEAVAGAQKMRQLRATTGPVSSVRPTTQLQASAFSPGSPGQFRFG